MKSLYRQSEHALQAAKAVSTVASLQATFRLPRRTVEPLLAHDVVEHGPQHAVGAAGGMVFEHPTSWDVLDRFNKVQEISADNSQKP